jgi:hypothetical protein
MDLRSQRGSGLLLAIITVLVVTTIGVAMIRFTSRELAGATAARQSDALASCAEAGRQLLLNQFRGVGIAPTTITALNIPLDAQGGGHVSVVGGHVDQVTSGVQVDQVKLLPAGTFGTASRGSSPDITNIIGGLGNLGTGVPYRVLVHCVDHGQSDGTGGRQLEVEFGVQFGI